jgi:hypothetical protein
MRSAGGLAGRLDAHRHDRAHADQLTVARFEPLGVERFIASTKPPEHRRRILVREFNRVRGAGDELDADLKRHAREANDRGRCLLSVRSSYVAGAVHGVGAPAEVRPPPQHDPSTSSALGGKATRRRGRWARPR